jgi:hypothetical protein
MKKIILILFLIANAVLFSQQIVVQPLSINSKLDDFAPSITRQAQEMYMTSERDGEQLIYKG